MATWKDVSSFNESDKTRVPYVFELRLGGLKLGLTGHTAYPGKWVCHLQPFNWEVVLEEIGSAQ